MNDTVHFAEYTVTKKREGKYRRNRILAIIGFIAFFVLVLIIMLLIIGAGAVIWYVPLSPTAMFLAKKIVYDRYFNTEYNYCIAGGTFILNRINSERYKKEILRFKLSDADMIVPYVDEYKEKIDRLAPKTRIEAVSSMSASDIYAISVNDTLVFVEGISKTVRLFKLYNKNTEITNTAL
ncbi:MAG: hypothetical protein J6D09_05435 [Clostridia bacterium]|nr:hypothetical protein [Clostridia bacterium]